MHDIFVLWVQNQVVLSVCAQNQVGCSVMDRFAESPRDCGSGKGSCVVPGTCIPQSPHPRPQVILMQVILEQH